MGYSIKDEIDKAGSMLKPRPKLTVLELIERSGANGITLGVIYNRLRGAKRANVNAELERLVDEGSIKAEQYVGGNKHKTLKFTIA